MERLQKLEDDIKIVVMALEKCIKRGIQVAQELETSKDDILALQNELDNAKNEILQMQNIINEQHNRLDMLEHNVNNETHLHDWMSEESRQHAIDFGITPKEISRGFQDRNDAMLRFGRVRY